MKRLLATILLSAALVQPAWAQKGAGAREPDPIVQFSDEDAAMNAAIASARATYPQFLAAFNAAPARDAENYMVKVGMVASGGGHEHIWVSNLRREGERLFGQLANEPQGLPGLHLGSRVEIDHELVSDWAIMSAEGMYGSYTTRVMLPHIDPNEAAQLRQMLTPSPTPAHWSS